MATSKINATLLGIEAGYPERDILSDEFTKWDVSLPDKAIYGDVVTNLSPDYGTVVDKLRRRDLDIATEQEIVEISRMGTGDVITHYGADFAEKLVELRCPLGRTGLNGVGIFYEAGSSVTSDMVVAHVDDDGSVSVPLVYTRRRWNTPGGFRDAADDSDLDCAMREFYEETGHDLSSGDLAATEVLSEIKPSDRTTDHGWLEAHVFAVRTESRFDVSHSIDTGEVNDAIWVKTRELPALARNKLLSEAKLQYINKALKALNIEVYPEG